MTGEEMREIRERLKWGQGRFAAMVNRDRQTIHLYETGKRPIPKVLAELIRLKFNHTDKTPGQIACEEAGETWEALTRQEKIAYEWAAK